MTYLKRLCWAVAIAAVVAGGASAQTTGGTTGGTLGGTTGGTLGSTTGGTLGSTGGLGGGQGAQNNAAQAPTIGSTVGGFGSSAVQQSNIIAGYYANPLYPGRAGALTSSDLTTVGQPGGFGQALYGSTSTGASGTGRATAGGLGRAGTTGGLGTTGGARTGTTGLGGMTAGRTGTTGGLTGGSTLGSPAAGLGGSVGTTGGLGRTGGGLGGTTGGLGGTTGGIGGRTGGFGTTGGIGGANSTNQQLSTGRSVAYTQELKFAFAPVVTPQLQTELTSMIASSSTLSSIAGLEAIVGDGGLVVLRGKVESLDDARLVENMIRLTPGVKDVRNDLQYPLPKAP